MAFSIDSYLFRLSLKRFKPDLTYLKELQRAHQEQVPIANFDVHLGRKRSWDINMLYDRIIQDQRGGLGVELNALFGHLLTQLGFRCIYVAIRDEALKLMHMSLLVQLKGRSWLVDVGREEALIGPDPLIENQVTLNYARYVRLLMDENAGWLYQTSTDAVQFQTQFSLQARESKLIEFVHLHDQLQDRSNTEVGWEKSISRIKEGGRLKLTESVLELRQGERTVFTEKVQNEVHFDALLREQFGLEWLKLIQ